MTRNKSGRIRRKNQIKEILHSSGHYKHHKFSERETNEKEELG